MTLAPQAEQLLGTGVPVSHARRNLLTWGAGDAALPTFPDTRKDYNESIYRCSWQRAMSQYAGRGYPSEAICKYVMKGNPRKTGIFPLVFPGSGAWTASYQTL